MAMRMWEITKLLIVVELVIVFTNASGMFTHQYYQADQGTGIKYTVGDIHALHASQKNIVMDAFDMGVGFIMAGLNLLLAVMNALFLLPSLSATFRIPVEITAIIQTMVYLEIVWGLAQWKAGRPGAAYE